MAIVKKSEFRMHSSRTHKRQNGMELYSCSSIFEGRKSVFEVRDIDEIETTDPRSHQDNLSNCIL